MKYHEITSTTDIPSSIKFFKGNKTSSIADYKKQYEITKERPIMDESIRPNRSVKNDAGEVQRMEPVNRIPITLQERIVETSVSFTFGNPVELVCENDDDTAQLILKAVKRILSDNKTDSFNRKVARELARSTEVAECWFPVKAESHEHYGFTTQFKIKAQLFTPWDGDELYPYFDETGDMVAFGRGYIRNEDSKPVNFFEVYTDEEKIEWKEIGGQWEVVGQFPNPLKKIPVVYAKQSKVEWYAVQEMITRLEKLISNFGDTNDYFGSPILALKGEVKSMSQKDKQGKVIQLDSGAEAEFLSWDNGPEAIKLEIETLLRLSYSLTQTPDISFDSVKGLREISGEALKMLFLDAHLKVKSKQEILDEYLQRRLNILKAFVGILNLQIRRDAGKLEIEPKITPFTITNIEDVIKRLSEATGGKALISQKTAIGLTGMVDDVEAEYQQIQEEETRGKSFDVFETTV